MEKPFHNIHNHSGMSHSCSCYYYTSGLMHYRMWWQKQSFLFKDGFKNSATLFQKHSNISLTLKIQFFSRSRVNHWLNHDEFSYDYDDFWRSFHTHESSDDWPYPSRRQMSGLLRTTSTVRLFWFSGTFVVLGGEIAKESTRLPLFLKKYENDVRLTFA